jgi:hypothetical protein
MAGSTTGLGVELCSLERLDVLEAVLHAAAELQVGRPLTAAAPAFQRPRREAKLIGGVDGLQQTRLSHHNLPPQGTTQTGPVHVTIAAAVALREKLLRWVQFRG